jgi:hypothetical protein
MAAAHVSAAAGLVLASGEMNRRLGRRPKTATVERWLRCTARRAQDPKRASMYGAGLLDLRAALDPTFPCPGIPEPSD